MKKVIYIGYAHLSAKLERDWYMGYLRANGVVTEYWDVVSLLFGGFEEANTIERDYVFTPGTYKEFEKMLCLPENRNAIYVILVGYEGRFVKFFRLLSKYDCRMFLIMWGVLPVRRTTGWQKIVAGLSDPMCLGKRILNKIRGIAYKKLKLIKPYDVVFAGGNAAMSLYPDAGKVIPINLVDYDHFTRIKSLTERVVAGQYAVFLDIYLPFQKNNLKVNNVKALEPHNYFSACNRFFDRIERKFGVKVVIAVHPRADYGNSPFEGRKIYQGLTPELVKDANFVISHNSTSISYAVLNSKPIIFIYTDEMQLLYKNTATMILINDMVDCLKANVYNIDEVTEGDQILISNISLERYESYKYNYLTTRESEHSTTQEIFWNEIVNS